MHNPEIAEAEPAAFPGARDLTDEDRARGRAASQVVGRLRKQIEASARKGVEALLIERPEAIALEVGDLARLAATRITVDLVAGNVPNSSLHYAAQAVRTLVEVSRLEAGKVTSLTATVTAGADDLAAMLDSVRRDARAALAPPAGSAPIGQAEGSEPASEAGERA